MKKGIIKVSILYPGGVDINFDMDYYLNNHIPKVLELLGDMLKGTTIEKGISGGAPGSVAPYTVMTNIYFDTLKSFESSFGPQAAEIMADVDSFTNSQPIVQISEVVM